MSNTLEILSPIAIGQPGAFAELSVTPVELERTEYPELEAAVEEAFNAVCIEFETKTPPDVKESLATAHRGKVAGGTDASLANWVGPPPVV